MKGGKLIMSKKILIITITCFSCLFLFTGFVVGDKSEWTEEKIQERKGKQGSLTDEEKAANMKAWKPIHSPFGLSCLNKAPSYK